jgi:hypothetical protein
MKYLAYDLLLSHLGRRSGCYRKVRRFVLYEHCFLPQRIEQGRRAIQRCVVVVRHTTVFLRRNDGFGFRVSLRW